MASGKTAHVKLCPTRNISRIEITYNNVKEIVVYMQALQMYRQSVLQDFIYAIQGDRKSTRLNSSH